MSQDSVKFIHVRRFVQVAGPEDTTASGTITANGTEAFDCKGGTTVAYTVTPVGDGQNLLTYNVAHCSPKDNYCRATGRAVAKGRLLSSKNPTTNSTVTASEQVNAVHAILSHMGMVEDDHDDALEAAINSIEAA